MYNDYIVQNYESLRGHRELENNDRSVCHLPYWNGITLTQY